MPLYSFYHNQKPGSPASWRIPGFDVIDNYFYSLVLITWSIIPYSLASSGDR